MFTKKGLYVLETAKAARVQDGLETPQRLRLMCAFDSHKDCGLYFALLHLNVNVFIFITFITYIIVFIIIVYCFYGFYVKPIELQFLNEMCYINQGRNHGLDIGGSKRIPFPIIIFCEVHCLQLYIYMKICTFRT